jgi:hypothetical protein
MVMVSQTVLKKAPMVISLLTQTKTVFLIILIQIVMVMVSQTVLKKELMVTNL